jgi:hypothetical protein
LGGIFGLEGLQGGVSAWSWSGSGAKLHIWLRKKEFNGSGWRLRAWVSASNQLITGWAGGLQGFIGFSFAREKVLKVFRHPY